MMINFFFIVHVSNILATLLDKILFTTYVFIVTFFRLKPLIFAQKFELIGQDFCLPGIYFLLSKIATLE